MKDYWAAAPEDGPESQFLASGISQPPSRALPIFKRPPQSFGRQGERTAGWVLAHGHSVQFPLYFMVKKHKDVSGTMPENTPAMENAATNAATAAKRQPIKTIRIDDCSASIWARVAVIRGQSTTFYSVSFERSYKDRDGSYKYTKSFDADSLGNVINLCQQASESIQLLQQ